jgi:hypothetical protein
MGGVFFLLMTNIEDVDTDEMIDFLHSLVEALEPDPDQTERLIGFLEEESILLEYWTDENDVFCCGKQK